MVQPLKANDGKSPFIFYPSLIKTGLPSTMMMMMMMINLKEGYESQTTEMSYISCMIQNRLGLFIQNNESLGGLTS